MSFVNRMTHRLALILPATFVLAIAGTVWMQSTATVSSARSKAGAESLQDPNAPQVATQSLRDWLVKTNELRARGLINLNSDFEFTVDAKRNSDCRLSDVVVLQKSGDQRLMEVMRESVAALSDSGLLMYLGDRQDQEFANTPCVSIPLHFNFKSDSSEIVSSVEYPATTPERAVEISRAYKMLILSGRTVKRGHPDELIYNAMNATSEGNQIIVHFRMSRTNVDDILRGLQNR